MTTVVNLKFTDNWDVYLGRANSYYNLKESPWANKYIIGKDGSREEVIAKFKEDFYKRLETDDEFKQLTLGLKDKILSCYCKQPNQEVPCHGDVIAEYLDVNKK